MKNSLNFTTHKKKKLANLLMPEKKLFQDYEMQSEPLEKR